MRLRISFADILTKSPIKCLTLCRAFAVTFYCLYALNIQAQNGPPAGVGSGSNSSSTVRDSLAEADKTEERAKDTVTVRYFLAEKLGETHLYADTTVSASLYQFAFARRQKFDYFNLGSIASAAYPSFFSSQVRDKGFDLGQHAYDVYYLRGEQLPFFQLSRALFDFSFSAATQANLQTGILFARDFAKGIHLTVDYRRLSNLSETTNSIKGVIYDAAKGRTVSFSAGLWYQSENKKYDGFLTYTSNVSQQVNYGGITSDSVFKQPSNQIRYTATNYLANAETRQVERDISYLHYFRLNNLLKSDTMRQQKREYLLSHRFTYAWATYKMDDKANSNKPTLTDTTFYGNLLTDARGLRYFLGMDKVENTLFVATTRQRATQEQEQAPEPPKGGLATSEQGLPQGQKPTFGRLEGLNTQQNDRFQVGLTQQLLFLGEEGINPTVKNNLILRGQWLYTPSDIFQLNLRAHFNVIGSNLGDYGLYGSLRLQLPKIGALTLDAHSQLYEPNYLQQKLYVTQVKVWENSFNKTLDNHFAAILNIPLTKTEVGAAYSLLSNYTYFDTLAQARQIATPFSIVQFYAMQPIKVGGFHLDNTITLQQVTDVTTSGGVSQKVLDLPSVSTKHSIYWEGMIFKGRVMLLRVGADVRYHTAFYAPRLMPLTGQWFQQRVAMVGDVPVVDLFLSLRVQTFRFFVKMDNFSRTLGVSEKVYYQAFQYPVPESAFRFGLSWLLRG
jgi:hypothetical protein